MSPTQRSPTAPDGSGNPPPRRSGRRSALERGFIRLAATAGIVGVGVLLGAVLSSSKVDGWIIGLVIAVVSVVLAGLLWSARTL